MEAPTVTALDLDTTIAQGRPRPPCRRSPAPTVHPRRAGPALGGAAARAFRGPHLCYAIQWSAFATIAIAGISCWSVERWRERAPASPGDASDRLPPSGCLGLLFALVTPSVRVVLPVACSATTSTARSRAAGGGCSGSSSCQRPRSATRSPRTSSRRSPAGSRLRHPHHRPGLVIDLGLLGGGGWGYRDAASPAPVE